MILPGIIGPSDAAALTAFLALVERNRQILEARKEGRLDRFPARVDNYQNTTGRYSWTEQTFDSLGQRYDRPGGRTGSFTYSPAYGYGGGVVTEFPHPTWLTRRVVAVESGSGGLTSIGPVYEFPLACACVAGPNADDPDDSGSGGGHVLIPCCPNPLPRTMHATWVVTAGACAFLNGAQFPLTYDPMGQNWFGVAMYCSGTLVIVSVTCPQGGALRASISLSNIGTCFFTAGIGGLISPPGSCDPVQMTVAGLTVSDCPGATLSLVITE